MTPEETAALVTAIVALLTAIAGWFRARSLHEHTQRKLEVLERRHLDSVRDVE